MNITKRKPFTPGEILKEEFMEPYSLTQVKLAEHLKTHPRRINEIINGKRALTPDTAIRLAKLFKMSPDFWLNLQQKIDLWESLNKPNQERDSIKPINLGKCA